VDFGIWNKNINLSQLSCPLDVISGNVPGKLGLILRKQNDRGKPLAELDANLRNIDPHDPVSTILLIWGWGCVEKF